LTVSPVSISVKDENDSEQIAALTRNKRVMAAEGKAHGSPRRRPRTPSWLPIPPCGASLTRTGTGCADLKSAAMLCSVFLMRVVC
jgi:hypothetical protein